ncbi:MAG: DGQHR domain-containing protein [Thermoplasmatota archaeon]
MRESHEIRMLATRIQQKDSIFYFANIHARELLKRVRFVSRYHFEGETIEASQGDDPIAKFIGKIERSDNAFQRPLKRQKIRDLVRFYESVSQQPAIPGTILLVTGETLSFRALQEGLSVGHLSDPSQPFDIIDGQHRLAGLHFFSRELEAKGQPGILDRIEVPILVFDGKSADYAAEMFVTINATQTKINKSHLVDLLEKVTMASPQEKFAARIVQELYKDDRSPFQYRINLLGGRSKAEKWILQSELYNEIYRLVKAEDRLGRSRPSIFDREFDLKADKAAPYFIDWLRAVRRVFGDAWDSPEYECTDSVCLKAYIRVLGQISDTILVDNWKRVRTEEAFMPKVRPWAEFKDDLKSEGFFARFAAKGPVERVRLIQKELARRVA